MVVASSFSLQRECPESTPLARDFRTPSQCTLGSPLVIGAHYLSALRSPFHHLVQRFGLPQVVEAVKSFPPFTHFLLADCRFGVSTLHRSQPRLDSRLSHLSLPPPVWSEFVDSYSSIWCRCLTLLFGAGVRRSTAAPRLQQLLTGASGQLGPRSAPLVSSSHAPHWRLCLAPSIPLTLTDSILIHNFVQVCYSLYIFFSSDFAIV